MSVDAFRAQHAASSIASRHALDWVNFFLAALLVGFGPFISVHLANRGWTPEGIGFVLTVSGLAGLIAQIPAGELIDVVRSRRGLIGAGTAAAALALLLFGLRSDFPSVVIAALIQGAAGSMLGPAIAAISLGLVGHDALAERLGRNQRFASIGGLAAAAVKRAFGNQVRGLLRPFGIKLPSRQGTKKFAEAVHAAVRHDALLHASVTALMEALAAIESQIARLDDALKELARRSQVCWRLMSVPGVGPITALAFMAAIEDVGRFGRMRDIAVYLGLTPKRYQSGETDVALGISHQGDAMARHYLYEAANVLLTTVRKPSTLKSWGLKLLKRRGPKRARVAVARKLAVLLGRIWKDGTHFGVASA